MNPKQISQSSPGLTLWEVYYILFRHKWLIVILAAVGLAASILVRMFWPVPYHSEAKVLIKYVIQRKPPEQSSEGSQPTTQDVHGENIINSEIVILTSLDLANMVVDAMTPGKILAKAGGGTNRTMAASLIKRNLEAVVSAKSDVIELVFYHPDPGMVQPILGQIIETYLKRHTEIRRPEWNEFLTRETDEVRHKLEDTEAQLREAKSKANIISLEDSRKTIGDMMAKLQQEIYDAEADYAGYEQTINEMSALVPKPNPAETTNAAPAAGGATPVPSDKVESYRSICEQLSLLRSQEQELLLKYTTNNSMVQSKHGEVARAEALKKQLEEKYPGLKAMKPVETKGAPAAAGPDPTLALREEMRKADALAAKIKALTNQMAEVQSSAALMERQEGAILQLQRDKDLQGAEFSYYSRKLEESRADEAIGPGNSNISVVESPTPPVRDEVKITKVAVELFFGLLVLALGLPFVMEIWFDRSLKHPLEVKARLGLPFFITIPAMSRRRAPRRAKDQPKPSLLPDKAGNGAEAEATPQTSGPIAVWEKSQGLQPFFETLRDRLMTYFEMINLTHKPKLVAVTSCGQGAGVTTTAAGLASSLSETGDGNVLLVNMNVRDGEAHHFYKGKLACGLDEVLEKETREGALVRDNLYLAREQEGGANLPRILPKRFNHLLPKMKASDFDYIIFDMPPVSQISITPRLARFMDMMLLVVESEKTDRDVARRVADMLSESKTHVGIVLNKNRSYLPERLRQEV